MLSETLTARSYRFAFLFAGAPEMKRKDNLRFYDKVTAQRIDLPSFVQKQDQIVLEGKDGPRNVRHIEVGHFGDKFRLLVIEEHPQRAMELFLDMADGSWRAFREVWGNLDQRLALAEARLQYTATTKEGDATKFLLGSCLRLPEEARVALGRQLSGVGMRLVSPLQISRGEPQIPLANADFDLHVETLVEDPSLLYLEIVAHWPSVMLDQRVPQQEGMPLLVNTECRQPSDYLKELEGFVTRQVTQCLRSVAT